MLMSLYLVYRIYRLQNPNGEHAPYFLIPAAFLLFSLGQRDNWIWENQKCMFMMLACAYGVAWALERFPRSKRTFLIGVIAAVVASWSFLSGNVLWAVIPVALWLNGYRKFSTYALWISIAAVHALLYLNGYVHAPFAGDQGDVGESLYFVHYLLAFIGAPFSPETHFILETYNSMAVIPGGTRIAQMMGIVGVFLLSVNGLYAIFVRKLRLSELSAWSVLIGFGLANGVLLGLGRGGRVFYALASRYITLAAPLWIGIFALMFANVIDALSRSSVRRWRSEQPRHGQHRRADDRHDWLWHQSVSSD